MKHSLLVLALTAAFAAPAQALTTGDIAFTSFNADEDGWSIVTFVDIAANTTIYFRDDEWNGSPIGSGGAFNSGEGLHTWNTGASVIAAGTVVRFAKVDQASRSVTFGSLSSSGDTGVNATNETIYAYLGSNINTPTVFLTAISNGNFGTNGTLVNTGLTLGTTAFALPSSADWGQYTGPRSGEASFADYKPMVMNLANWDAHNGLANIDASAYVPNTTAFTITPVPEPETYALMLAGLGLVGYMARRRKS